VVPQLATKWSHEVGRQPLRVVPSSWQATGELERGDERARPTAQNGRVSKALRTAQDDPLGCPVHRSWITRGIGRWMLATPAVTCSEHD